MSNEMYLTDQAAGAVMMALQRSLLEQSDIVPVIKGFKFKLSEEGLVVLNPPTVKVGEENNLLGETEHSLRDEVSDA